MEDTPKEAAGRPEHDKPGGIRIYEFGPPTSPIEVVVPTADVQGRWFPGCLESLRQYAPMSLHIVGVESSGPEFSFPRSVNVGIARTTNDVFILNDDTRLAPEALAAVIRARRERGSGAYQCYIHTLDGKPYEIGWYYDRSLAAPLKYAWIIRGPFATYRKLVRGEFFPFFPIRRPKDGFDGFSFNACLLTRDVYDEVGRLDEAFPLGWDDMDYSLRCHEFAIPFYGVPRAVVRHSVGGSRIDRGYERDPRSRASHRHLLEKWPRERILETLDKGHSGRLVWT